MNCLLAKATSAELDICSVYVKQKVATSSESNEYVTSPLAEVLLPDQSSSEEEVYASFEEAISGRTSALHNQLNRYSHPALFTQNGYNSGPMRRSQTTESNLATSEPCRTLPNWQRFVVLVSLPLNFLLAGFDLMGLLVMHMVHLH